MSEMPKTLFTVGELARKSGVTVRTLQYYDKCDVLKPSSHSEGGRRMYTRQDGLKLQQILFLKTLGFSLEEIRDQILPSSSPKEISYLLKKQKQMMDDQIKQLRNGKKLLDQTLNEIESGQTAELDNLFAIVGALMQNNPYAFMLRNMPKEDIVYYADQIDQSNKLRQLNDQLKDLTAELLLLYERKESPDSQVCQIMAKNWWDIVLELTNGDQTRITEMFAKGADTSNWPEESHDLHQAMELLGEALSIYFASQGIEMPEI